MTVGTADKLSYKSDMFQNVIIGFCLYLIDRDLLFKVASEVDRVLKRDGNLYIIDFLTPYPMENAYKYDVRIKSYKMDYSKMFLWHPYYNIIYLKSFSHSSMEFNKDLNERIGLIVLKKVINS